MNFKYAELRNSHLVFKYLLRFWGVFLCLCAKLILQFVFCLLLLHSVLVVWPSLLSSKYWLDLLTSCQLLSWPSLFSFVSFHRKMISGLQINSFLPLFLPFLAATRKFHSHCNEVITVQRKCLWIAFVFADSENEVI